MSGEEHVRASARLRGERKFKEAIAVIESNRASFDDVSTIPALLQAFYAAREAGDSTKAREIAQELVKYDPEIPTIRKFLDQV
jgi:hypothetical protein